MNGAGHPETGGGPPLVLTRCQVIWNMLVQRGIPFNREIPRPKFDQLLAQAFLLSDAQIRNYARTGELHGLWSRRQHVGSKPGGVLLLPARGMDEAASTSAPAVGA